MTRLELQWSKVIDLRAKLLCSAGAAPIGQAECGRYNAMIEAHERRYPVSGIPRTAWVAIALRLHHLANAMRDRKGSRTFVLDRALDAYHRGGVRMSDARGVPTAIRDAYIEACDLQRSVL